MKIAIVFIIFIIIFFIILLIIGGAQSKNFNLERNEIITTLIEADTWTAIDNGKKFSDEFIQIKDNNLKKYFNVSEVELFEALDKNIGKNIIR